MKINKEKLFKILLSLALVAFTVYVFAEYSPDKVRSMIQGAGFRGPLIYIALWTFLPVGFFPVPTLALAGGLGFGLVWGSIYTFIGAAFNMALMFFIARYLAKDSIKDFVVQKFRSVDRLFSLDQKKLGISLMVARFLPLIPYNVLNYAYGLTPITFWNYLISSLIGIIPGVLAYINIGDKSLEIGSKDFYLSILFMVLISVVSFMVARKVDWGTSDRDNNSDL